ncbi:hypothetical protein ZIOFF_019590 [Zingiber officinale]|uniref:Uncharacterized protein n=1 Tax=Zingiber officinale TaxID=94328 RepID=A0A8J5LHK8_ZINOF|nr:hypothetical protein ZIOFF_023006 [Zingiber officinale]KAG6519513.1 hypothetical protein ZIOFF_023007 [Zingiber officinale]KAG6522450.1 hypothetical protein ZIOFF_019590 [Zingiber officinale]
MKNSLVLAFFALCLLMISETVVVSRQLEDKPLPFSLQATDKGNEYINIDGIASSSNVVGKTGNEERKLGETKAIGDLSIDKNSSNDADNLATQMNTHIDLRKKWH